MATMNPFDILGGDDNDDPQLIAMAVKPKKPAEAPAAAKGSAAGQGKGGKTAVPAQGGRDNQATGGNAASQQDGYDRGSGYPRGSRDGRSYGPSQGRGRGDFQNRGEYQGRGGPGGYQGRGGYQGQGRGDYQGSGEQRRDYQDRRGYNSRSDYQHRDNKNQDIPNENGFPAEGGAAPPSGGEGGSNRDRAPLQPYRGGAGRRGPYRDGETGDDNERPRRMYDRRSGTGRGYEMKRDGAGRGNWGTAADETAVLETETEKEENAPVTEKPENPDEPAQTEDNKDHKEPKEKTDAEKEKEQEEEDKEMTLEEYEKVLEEKRKALLAMKMEERKVEIDKELLSMQPLSTKKGTDEVFVKLGTDKESLKKKENADNAERAKKSLPITEFLKPAEGERYYPQAGRGRGRGRGGERGGFRGGYSGGGGGGYSPQVSAPHIEDKNQFPTLGGKSA